jgi:hypothetical protein
MLVDDPQIVQDYRVKASERAQIHYRWGQVVHLHAAFYQSVLNGESLGTLKKGESAKQRHVAED